VRLSAVLLLLSLAGIAGGAVLIGTWAVGTAIIADSLAVGVWALYHDDGKDAQPSVHAGPGTTLQAIFDKARAS
jgi:hypothetical protein